MPAAYYDFFRKILLQPDGVTLEADGIDDTLTITGGAGVAFNPNATNDSFEIDVDYQLYVPIGTTEIRLNDVNSNYTGVKITAGSNISIGRNSNNEITITSTVGGTSQAISNLTQTSPVVVTTSNPHSFTEGIAVTITDVAGMTELNGNEYYMNVLTSTTFALYEDANLTTPLNGTGFTAYTSGGVVTAEYGAPQALSQLADVDLVGTPPVNGTYLQFNGSYWQAGTTLAGNFTGSVFADDSTLLVDGVNGVIPWSVINGTPAFLTSVAFDDLTTTPTTLVGYGITDAATSAQGALADSALQSVAFDDLTTTPTTLAEYGITDAATSAQGALADSALQSGDNISTLTNDSAYLTSGDNISTLTNDSAYLTSVAFDDLTTTPTTLEGYGITDAATSAQGALADTALQSVAFDDLTTTPTTIAGYGITDAFSGGYADLTDKPVLATVATSGSYNDLTNQPTASGMDLLETHTITTSAQSLLILDYDISQNTYKRYKVYIDNLIFEGGSGPAALGWQALNPSNGSSTGLLQVFSSAMIYTNNTTVAAATSFGATQPALIYYPSTPNSAAAKIGFYTEATIDWVDNSRFKGIVVQFQSGFRTSTNIGTIAYGTHHVGYDGASVPSFAGQPQGIFLRSINNSWNNTVDAPATVSVYGLR